MLEGTALLFEHKLSFFSYFLAASIQKFMLAYYREKVKHLPSLSTACLKSKWGVKKTFFGYAFGDETMNFPVLKGSNLTGFWFRY